MVFGGVSAMVFGDRYAPSMAMLWRKVDVRSMFFATVFVIILLVLAYLTNPNETSFRTYLTEQSFRQHLTRLDENNQDEQADREESGVHYTHSRRSPAIAHKPGVGFDSKSPFHFVNRASVSLRTPKHVFRSFGILTIAAVYPPGSNSRNIRLGARNKPVGSLVSNSWFIGAFGKWWCGGTVYAWSLNPKDAERCGSGVLDLKALDSLEGYDGLPFTTSLSSSLRLPINVPDVPSKSRGTERPVHRTASNTPRSTTPPPLPKSASLPLHAPRLSTSSSTPLKTDRNTVQRHAQTSAPTQDSVADQVKLNTPPTLAYSPSTSTLLDQSPVIAEILRQISLSKGAVQELRTQLTDFRAAAADSQSNIRESLEFHRERKRTEDASRLELKTRTKTLEDSKRAAESSRRDAEKRLRAAEGARDNAGQRIQRLDTEINALQERMREDERAIVRCKEEGDAAECAATEELELKRKEIKVAEDVVAALNARAKELEERIVLEEERLARAREQAEIKKQDQSFFPLHTVSAALDDTATQWSAYHRTQDPHTHINTSFTAPIDVFSQPYHVPHSQGTGSSVSTECRDLSVSPKPKHLSLAGISNFREAVSIAPDVVKRTYYPYPSLLPSNLVPSTRFSPFSESDTDSPSRNPSEIPPSPTTTSLIPTGLISSFEGRSGTDSLTGSFKTDGDAVMAPDWRKMYPRPLPVEHPSLFSSSPTTITHPSFDAVDQEDPFEIRPPPPLRHRLTSDSLDLQRAMFMPSRTSSDPQPLTRARSHEEEDKASTAHRRWFSADPKEKKGLNPEAKVFRFTKNAGAAHLAPAPFEPFEHASAASSTLSIPSVAFAPAPAPAADEPAPLFASVSMRAFAPSRAEREALQRGLGGSTNASLERLPTLSEVAIASMPPSPSHVHTIAAHHAPDSALAGSSGRTLLPPGLSWLQIPLMKRTPKFSPWEDGDETPR